MPVQPGPAPEPQPVVVPLTQAAIFLVLTVNPGGEDAVRDLLPDVAGLQRSVGFRVPEGSLAVVVAIGPWQPARQHGPHPRLLHRDNAPSADFLDDPPGPPAAAHTTTRAAGGDGSLGIGSLKGQEG